MALIRQLVASQHGRPGDIVLDPFLGSGTTAVCSEELGRRWVGIEKRGDYAEIARQRVEQWWRKIHSERRKTGKPRRKLRDVLEGFSSSEGCISECSGGR